MIWCLSFGIATIYWIFLCIFWDLRHLFTNKQRSCHSVTSLPSIGSFCNEKFSGTIFSQITGELHIGGRGAGDIGKGGKNVPWPGSFLSCPFSDTHKGYYTFWSAACRDMPDYQKMIYRFLHDLDAWPWKCFAHSNSHGNKYRKNLIPCFHLSQKTR
jgi:hypothetical protein